MKAMREAFAQVASCPGTGLASTRTIPFQVGLRSPAGAISNAHVGKRRCTAPSSALLGAYI